jgi:ADP-ribose pyrophosphatase
MQHPNWRRRSSTYVVDSPYMRLRADEVELPDGTIVHDYYIRESAGFVVVMALTADRRIVLVRQYRYGSDAIHLELPAGSMSDGENPLACAQRELAEETGYEAAEWIAAGSYYAEPVRSDSKAFLFFARNAAKTRPQQLDPTEVLEVELASIDDFRAMLADGRIDTGHAVCAGYRILDYLGEL